MNAFRKSKLNMRSILFIASTAVLCMAVCVVLFCLNITPTIALEQELRCGIAEHVHTDDCYDSDIQVCEKQAHSHNGNCYIVLLNENNINTILSLLGESDDPSLEHIISDVMHSALTFNGNLNTAEDAGDPVTLTQSAVEKLNSTISDEESLPPLVLNENLNTVITLAAEDEEDTTVNNTGGNVSLLGVGDDPVTSNYNANIYVYLDGEWTCIGSLPFEISRNGNRYNSTLETSELLELVNSSLGTQYTYDSFDISVSSSLNGTYSSNNIGVGSVTTTIGYRQSNNNARATKYVHLIPSNGGASSTAFAFYTVQYVYPDGTTTVRYVRSGTTVTLPEGNYEWTDDNGTYAAGEAVTITNTTTFYATTLGPITNININYDVAFPDVNGVTVTTEPTIAGLSTGNVTDGFTEGSSAVVRNVSQQSVQGKVDGNTTGLSRVIQFKGWRVGNTDIIIQPNTTLIWEELLQYATGASVRLTAVWEYDAVQTASFFIRFDSVAVDTDGNITGQDSNLYTSELYAAFVGGIDPSLGYSELHDRYHIADTTQDNSYGADQAIRALYGERADGIWLSSIPSDEYIFDCLVEYAETGYLSVDGVAVRAEDLNDREYAIRWYVFKCQSDAWHIDGKLVKKEGVIHVYKTFAGNKELIAEAKDGFYIDAYNTVDDIHTTLDFTNYNTYDPATETYMWEISNVDYGEYWEITEYPHLFDDPAVEFSVYSEYTVMDAIGNQSVSGAGTSLTVSGMTYALDEGVDEVLRAEFTNIYNKSNSIVIKKQDSRTGVSIGGATFQLLQNGEALEFNYNSIKDRYEYAPGSGSETVLSGTSNGYFEISIENFSYDLGPITVREITPPEGYTPIGDIEIGYTDENKTIGIIGGNSELIKYSGGILIVGNSTESSSVTVNKSWECPENEWRDVTVQLLANGKLVTTVIAGVEPEVVLSSANGWTYTWDNLPVYVNGTKIEWTVRETRIGDETAKADGSFVNWLVSYGLPKHTVTPDGNENIELTVTNTTKRVMLRLTKTDLGKTAQLPGASFLLEAVDANGDVIQSEVAKNATTGDAGTLVFDNLKCGVRYRLTETAAPNGFLPLNEYIYFTINEDGSVSVEESYYAEAGGTAYNITVRNAAVILMPETGGNGIYMLYAISLLLCGAAVGIFIHTLRKRRCRN